MKQKADPSGSADVVELVRLTLKQVTTFFAFDEFAFVEVYKLLAECEVDTLSAEATEIPE